MNKEWWKQKPDLSKFSIEKLEEKISPENTTKEIGICELTERVENNHVKLNEKIYSNRKTVKFTYVKTKQYTIEQ